MAAIAGKFTGKVLVQFGDSDPIEIGTIEVPIHVGTVPTLGNRGELRISAATIETPDTEGIESRIRPAQGAQRLA